MTTTGLRTRQTSERASLDGDLFNSDSLNFADLVLCRLFPVNQTGFYVDIGAGHPRFGNDTFPLYQRGWRGINIEPSYGFHAALMEERSRDINLRVVLSDSSGEALTYDELDGSGPSICDVERATASQTSARDLVRHEIPVTTLSSILTEAGIDHIHVLKVEVKGFEEKVLNGNDWEKFRPDVVVVVAAESSVRRPTTIHSCMDLRGYRHVYFDGLNDFYLEREFAVPEGLNLPPYVSAVVPRGIADLRRQVQEMQANFTDAEESALSLQTRVESLRTNSTITEEYAISLETQVESLRTKFATAEEYAISLETQVESLRTKFATAEEYALSLETQVESMRTKCTTTEEYALSLETQVESLRTKCATAEEYDLSLERTAEALAAENRRLGHQMGHLASENRRLRQAAEQMRAELLLFNRLLEPLHAKAEQRDPQRRDHNEEPDGLNNRLVAAKARLASVYSSRSWRLTAPLRWCDDIQRRLVRRLRKLLSGDD
jgi:FkbM family methyltransferase